MSRNDIMYSIQKSQSELFINRKVYKMSCKFPICIDCKHYICTDKDNNKHICKAFPNGIPDDLFWNKNNLNTECNSNIKFEIIDHVSIN